jgi:hypothetical protein
MLKATKRINRRRRRYKELHKRHLIIQAPFGIIGSQTQNLLFFSFCVFPVLQTFSNICVRSVLFKEAVISKIIYHQ